MTKATTFSRQNLLLVVVLVLESKGLYYSIVALLGLAAGEWHEYAYLIYLYWQIEQMHR